MPELYLITTMFDSHRYEVIKENIKGSKYGFSFDTLFSIIYLLSIIVFIQADEFIAIVFKLFECHKNQWKLNHPKQQ